MHPAIAAQIRLLTEYHLRPPTHAPAHLAWLWFLTATAWARAIAISVSAWASAMDRRRSSAGQQDRRAGGHRCGDGSTHLRTPGINHCCGSVAIDSASKGRAPGSCCLRGSIRTSGPWPSGWMACTGSLQQPVAAAEECMNQCVVRCCTVGRSHDRACQQPRQQRQPLHRQPTRPGRPQACLCGSPSAP
jgi:hypothetical protein